ncbi:hypothetical protein KJ780_05270 [Candidatus Micrarchaeota archaeon]|nr:hypothetical protein [Candidatus Micrarchaeota archaeon]
MQTNAPTLRNNAFSERMRLANVLRAHTCQLSALNERYWTIIGYGSIGAKADELMKKAWAVERAGFELNHRTVLAMGFFEDFKKRNRIYAALGRSASGKRNCIHGC